MLDLDCCDLIINQTTCGTNIPFWLSQFFPLLNLLYLSLLVNIGDYKFTIILLVFFFQSENGSACNSKVSTESRNLIEFRRFGAYIKL